MLLIHLFPDYLVQDHFFDDLFVIIIIFKLWVQ